MAAKTNYIQISIAMGFSLIGLALFIACMYLCFLLISSKNKKEKIIGIAEIVGLVILLIIGYQTKVYMSPLKILFSNVMSAFVAPIIFFIALYIMNISFAFKKIKVVGTSLVFLGIGGILLILFTTATMYCSTFLGSEDFINWANKNFTYYDKEEIMIRENLYGSSDFNNIIDNIILDLKEEAVQKNLSEEETKDFILNLMIDNYYYKGFNLLEYKPDITSANEYICHFRDETRYNEQNEYPDYYCKIDINTGKVVSILYDYYGVTLETANKYGQNFKTLYGGTIYSIECLKAQNKPIVAEEINKILYESNIISGKSGSCKNVEETNDELKITLYSDFENQDYVHTFNKNTGEHVAFNVIFNN